MSHPDDRDDGEPDDEELAELADELSDVLRELRDELRASREAREAEPAGAPEPDSGGRVSHAAGEVTIDLPTATDILAFTDERLIPGAIMVLEANIKALQLLQKGIRLARPDRAGENAQAVRSHAESLSRSTLERLDDTLANLQNAAAEGALPENEEARDVLAEARRLREELDDALERRGADAEPRGAPDADDEPGEDDDEGPPSPWGDQPEVDVDVEGELESIKAELGKVDDEPDEDEESSGDDESEEASRDDEDERPPGDDDEDGRPSGDDGDEEASGEEASGEEVAGEGSRDEDGPEPVENDEAAGGDDADDGPGDSSEFEFGGGGGAGDDDEGDDEDGTDPE